MPKSYSKLRGRIVEKYGTLGAFCDAIGMSRQAFGKKLSGETPFTTTQMLEYSEILGIPRKEMLSYFFDGKVAKSATPQ